MNKVFLGLILAVCILGMALVMLNNRLGRKPDQRQAPPVAEVVQPPSRSPVEIEDQARAMETARSALVQPESAGRETALEAGISEREPVVPPRLRPKSEPEARPEPRKPEPKQELAVAPEPKPAPKPREQTVKPEPAPASEQPKQAAASNAGAGSRTATRFVIYARDKGATVRVGGNAKVEYSSMTLENPNRVVVDLAGDWKFPPNPGIPKNDLVSAVRVGQNGDKTRLVIDLKAKPRKVILVPFKNGDGVDVRVDK